MADGNQLYKFYSKKQAVRIKFLSCAFFIKIALYFPLKPKRLDAMRPRYENQ